ncbi:MAG: acyl-ACP--UDP-N-acetylglucosamine O-acyltransferase [Phycisphaeraceae bacterium]
MARIHATAIVEEEVELAPDVEVGPGCLLRGPIHIGAGTRLIGHVFLEGPLTLGGGNVLYPGACLGFAAQDRKFDPRVAGAGVVIGDHNVFREGSTVHRATGEHPTRLGDRNYLMVQAHVGHDSRVGDDCTLVNGAALAGHVELHDGVILSANASIHQFCRVGRLVMISGNRGMSRDVPPFCVCYTTRRVGGLNLVGLRRAGLRAHIRPLKHAFDLLYRKGHNRARAVELIERELTDDPLCMEFARFVREAPQGVTGFERPRVVAAARAASAAPQAARSEEDEAAD